jgi:hypothetical protein
MPSSTPSNGLDTANQKEASQPESWAVRFVFTLLSQAFEDRHFRKIRRIVEPLITRIPRMKRRFLLIRLIRVIRGCFSHRQKIVKARRATRTPSNGLETANQKGTSQPEWRAVRVRSPCSLCVAACTELNQLQRHALSSTLQQLRSLNIACEAFMVLINKRPKCLRQVGFWN